VLDTIATAGIKVAQFSGYESPQYCDSFGRFGVFKAFHVRAPFTFANVDPYHVTTYVLDSHSESMDGGTGTTFDWALATPIAARSRVMLAGGLTPENVGEAAKTVRPYAVDVSSGVERSPGKKDAHLTEEFFLSLRRAGFSTAP
jgi:phosphoribosylanthranilate isomerase